ncbi:D-beta-hydroxybutyrate dehydrogenase [Salmonella enterica subsp. enterica]|uniref:D-beta-hydroxybutyrate dehydrogenase n=1 Tax=Salmonella enterica I TaxID=59201 RepID=A0A379W3A1_SALET|nr:D-beta-hydroxybutyrate dehydrogenase [Salmonella enterica subsp. enterica]
MTTGTDFHVGIVGLGSMGMALRVHACAPGFPHGGPILTRKRARICSLKGLVGLPPAPGSSPASWMR